MAEQVTQYLTRTLQRSFKQHATTSNHYVCLSCSITPASSARMRFDTLSYIQRSQRSVRPHQPRCFSSSTAQLKKSSVNPKSSRKSPSLEPLTHKNDAHVPDNQHQRATDSEPDPYDHNLLQTAIDGALARLKENLTKTRDAGRVSSTMIEDLPIDLNIKGAATQGGPSHKSRTAIRDIASVVPKGGRVMQVFVSEESHVKPVSNAIQASPYSLVPQVDEQNALLLVVPVPPATKETRAHAAAEAKKCFDKASLDVRNARGGAQKRHKKMEQLKVVVPDELRKAHKAMEEVAKKGQDEVKRVYEGALKALQNV